MKYLFVVQGEGRGHFTQALSLKAMLERNGHEVVAVMVGCSARRSLPAFFTEKLNVELIRFQSPNFLPAPRGRQGSVLLSVLYNILLLPVYLQSMFHIRKTIRRTSPDVVVNFYELLCGLTYAALPPRVPMVSIAHQYYFLTPGFHYSGSDAFRFQLLNFYSRLTAANASEILALSFRRAHYPTGKIRIVPPLLRPELFQLDITEGNYLHGYLLNSGYADELTRWCATHKTEQLHFFWDRKNAPKETTPAPNLTLHTLDDRLFLHYMAGAKAYATTAGFESVCEAMYLQKPVLMVPTHIEQECNAMDALVSGAGVTADHFDLNYLLSFIPDYRKSQEFRYWVKNAEELLLEGLTQSAHGTHTGVSVAC